MPKPTSTLRYARCQGCPLQGQPLVPGAGFRDHPDIAFVAEAPGETEVEQGLPLIGKSGQFLRTVLADLKIDEDRCWFTNVCLCHPPGNATPKPIMAKACLGRLAAELAEVQPKLVVTLGNVASKFFAGHRLTITKVHGVYRELELRPKNGLVWDVGVVPTYHPAGVLRGPELFRDFVEELEYAKSILDHPETPPVVQPPYDNYEFITDQDGFDVFLERLSEAKQTHMVAVDLETDKMDWFAARILCIGFSWQKETAHVMDWSLCEQNLANTSALNKVLEGAKLVFHNGIYDVPFMHYNGLTNAFYYLDTMQAHYLLDERQRTHGLERLAVKYYRAPDYKTQFRLGIGVRSFAEDETFSSAITACPQEDLFNYNGADVDYTYRLAVDLTRAVKKDGQLPVLRDIEMEACRVFTDFTTHGLLVDRDYLDNLGRQWTDDEDNYLQQMREAVGNPEFNPNSTKQLAVYMYDVLGLTPFGGEASAGKDKIDEDVISKFIQTVDDPEAREYWTSRRTVMSSGMKGFGGEVKGLSPRSTSGYMLYWLRQQHEFPNLVLKWRHVRKRRSLYYDGIYGHMYMDGRVRPQYDLVSTKTGRKATNRPAIHNLPRGDEIYNIFVPDPGWCLIHADYQTAEMRMMAHYSGDKILLHALDTSDIHTLMAIEMFHLAPEQLKSMTKGELSDKRIAAKMICLTPDHLVVTAGLEWKPVGTLKIGEDLLAFTETGFQGRGSKRRWEVAKVTNNLREVGEVFEVLMSNGDKIKTTAAHRWLTRKTMKCGSLGPLIWIRTDELKAGKTWLPRVLDVWKAEKGTKAGYVRGILDSEGYISNHARLLGYSQNDNQVLEDTQAALEYFNVKTHLHANRNAYDILVQGNTFDKWKILGRFRPRRLLEKFKTSLPAFIMPDEGSGRWDRVEKITSLGTKEVVVLATSTGTLVAEGRPMHNTFGLPYGRSAAGLAPQLGVSKEEAEEYMNVYKRQFPGLFKWIDEQRARGVSEQGITSVFGRRRRFPLITGRFHKKEVERMAGNFAIQSAINDLTLLAYVNTYKALKAASIPVWPGAHIHDSINFTVPIPFWKAAVGEVVKAMAYKPFESEVNFPAEVEIGVRWGSMITVHKSGNWVGLDPEDESIPEWLKRTIPQGMPE